MSASVTIACSATGAGHWTESKPGSSARWKAARETEGESGGKQGILWLAKGSG